MSNEIRIKRALVSVSDKTGVVELAQVLSEFGCEIISTGGTAQVLGEAGVQVTEISRITKNPEALDGRMKTISFEIESAILFDRTRDADEAAELGIEPIDMVVCNLYPFEKEVEEEADLPSLIENIDIGGPTMIRAAAKNYKWVAVLTDPVQYPQVIEELRSRESALSFETRAKLMRQAFDRTADYDAAIAVEMNRQYGDISARFSFSDARKLRYGENPHQRGFILRGMGDNPLFDLKLLSGKEMSFNNFLDTDAALEAVGELPGSGCAVIKHNSACGLAEGAEQRKVFELAWGGDPVSAFGSVIAFNRPLELETARYLGLDLEDKSRRKFVEVVAAPEIPDDSLEYLKLHKSLRVLRVPGARGGKWKFRVVSGSLLMQDNDKKLIDRIDFVTEAKPDSLDDKLVEFGVMASRQLRSNAIAVVRKTDDGYFQLLGMGAGQPNRVTSVRLALDKCRENLESEHKGLPGGGAESETAMEDYVAGQMSKAVLVSDAFFPFPDSIEHIAGSGIRTVIQPGGSIRDKAVISKCDELNVCMAFTGVRHFKH
jgi:phosphoribosylaminoimidazolecarboxamide formyltransferase/IMP cyclohydrolase